MDSVRPLLSFRSRHTEVASPHGEPEGPKRLQTGARKLVGKVRNEIVVDVDRAQIEPRFAELRENYRMMREALLKVVYWQLDDATHP